MNRISVVICTYNRDKFIGDALKSLANQQLSKDQFEIIIVNNNSTDNTEAISLDFIKKHPELQVKYVVERQQGLSFARNRGIAEAQYPIITYIDDDAIAFKDFLQLIQKFFNTYPAAAGVGGKVIPLYETQEPAWMNKYLHGFVTKVDLGEKMVQYSPKAYPAGCNMTYKKEYLEAAGGFNNLLKWRADDKYIYFQVRALNDQIYYHPDLKVKHAIDADRITYSNFIRLSRKFGSEEGIRVRSESRMTFFKKIIEFIIKFGGSIILAIPYLLRGQFPKAKHIILYRYHALLGLLFP